MKKRVAVLLLVLVIGSLAMLFAWPHVREQVRTAELTLSAISQPRDEVIVSGYVRNFGAVPFSLETLLIEEPGKEPYRRQVALDADRRFELVLGKPIVGTYRVAVQTRKPKWGKGVQQGWLKTPALALGDRRSSQSQIVRAYDYAYPRWLMFAALTAAVGALAAIACFWPRANSRERNVERPA